jgi:hypothetical protein
MDFEIQKWIEEYELKEDTIQLLKDKGFDSYRSLSLLTEDIIKKDIAKAISPGQVALLREAVSILRPPQPPKKPTRQPPTTSQQESEEQTLQPPQQQPSMPSLLPPPPGINTPPAADTTATTELLAAWSAALGLQQQPAASTSTPHPTDPFGFGQGPNSGKKLRKLVDYISHHNNVDPSYEEGATVSIGGVEFAVARGKKLQKDKIRIAQYMEGALRILREMIIDDNLSIAQITDYTNYLIQIACFSQSMKWQSVLNYDTIYRREQQAQGFAWGTSSPFLMQSQLTPFEPPVLSKSNKRPYQESVHNPRTGRQICGRFNSTQGCQMAECKFDHVCKICFASHPRSQHDKPETAPKN